MSQDTLRVAAIQANAESCWSESQFREKVLSLTRRSKESGASVLVFPEDLGTWLQFCRQPKQSQTIRFTKNTDPAIDSNSIWPRMTLERSRFERSRFERSRFERSRFERSRFESLIDAFFERTQIRFLGDWLSHARIAGIVDRVFSEAARMYSVTIVAGSILYQRAAGLRNASFVYNPDGTLAGIYEKCHIIPAEKSLGLTGAPAPIVIRAGGLILGVCICYDLNSPEVIHSLADQGAQVILAPSMGIRPWPNYPYDVEHDAPQIARARETGLAVVRSSMCGVMFPGLYFDGHASITMPDGSVAARSKSVSTEEIVVATVPLYKPHGPLAGIPRP